MTRLVLTWYHGAVGPGLLGLVLLLAPGEVRAQVLGSDGVPVAPCCATLREQVLRTATVVVAPLPIRRERRVPRHEMVPAIEPLPAGWLRHWRCVALLH